MATTAVQRLQRDTGTNDTSLPPANVQDALDEAAETYSNATVAAAYARVIVLRGLLASAAPLVDYRQNESSRSASDISAHYKSLLADWQANLNDALKAAGGGAVLSGRTVRRPRRLYEYPGG